jgi:hypothetical protein
MKHTEMKHKVKKMNCIACNGSGKYIGFASIEDCKYCSNERDAKRALDINEQFTKDFGINSWLDNCVRVPRKIYFSRASCTLANTSARASAIIEPRSLKFLGKQAETLRLFGCGICNIELVEDTNLIDYDDSKWIQLRAEAVRHVLINQGIDAKRLITIGHGRYCPECLGVIECSCWYYNKDGIAAKVLTQPFIALRLID